MNRSGGLALVLSLVAVFAACSKNDAQDAPGAPVVSSAPTAPASAAREPQPPPAAESSAPAITGAPGASVAPSAAPSASTSATAAAASSSARAPSPPKSVAAAPTCGDKPLPPCPLFAWMKANTSPAMSSQNFDAMATALDKVVTFAPSGYPNWASIARDGAAAARTQDYDGVRASCRGCHNQYKDKYKKEMRDRPI